LLVKYIMAMELNE